MKSKVFLLASAIILNLVAFSTIVFIQYQVVVVRVSSAHQAVMSQFMSVENSFMESILSRIPFSFVLSTMFLTQLFAAVMITRRFSKNKKDILIIYGMQFVLLTVYILILAYPGYRELGSCRNAMELERYGGAIYSEDCGNIFENSRALIMYPLFGIYIAIFSITGALANVSLLGAKNLSIKSFVMSKRVLIVIVPILLFTLPTLFASKRPDALLSQTQLPEMGPTKMSDLSLQLSPTRLPDMAPTRTLNASLGNSPVINDATNLPPSNGQRNIGDSICGELKSSEDYKHVAFLKFESINSKTHTDSGNVCDPYINNLSLIIEKNDDSHTLVRRVDGTKKVISFRWVNDRTVKYSYRCGDDCEAEDTVTIP